MPYSEKLAKIGELPIYWNIDDQTKLVVMAGDQQVTDRLIDLLEPFDKFHSNLLGTVMSNQKKLDNMSLKLFVMEMNQMGNEIVREFNVMKEHQIRMFQAVSSPFYKKWNHFPTSDYTYGKSAVESNRLMFNVLYKMSYLLDLALKVINEYVENKEIEMPFDENVDIVEIEKKTVNSGVDYEKFKEELEKQKKLPPEVEEVIKQKIKEREMKDG